MKKCTLSLFLLVCLTMLTQTVCCASESGKGSEYVDFAILSTTDMHGKCWETNILTGDAEPDNMLRVSTAVDQIRREYGDEHVLLIDNGDLFQGGAVSQVQLMEYTEGKSAMTPAMAVCLNEIGYDAFILGNHEFNYDWNNMSNIYRSLEKNGIPVLAANVCYDGTDGDHAAGENAFTPYITKTITVAGHAHKIGILGFENTDIPLWDTPAHYPGLQFAHPGNDELQISKEAAPYLAQMKEEGCEFVIVCYHGGLGSADGEVIGGFNSESQGLRLVRETDSINMLILGHDHFTGYSNTYQTDQGGNECLIVNGGGKELTESIVRFSEGKSGELVGEVLDSRNLNLREYEIDTALEDIIRPYARLAEDKASQPVGITSGEWDLCSDYYLRQTDTMDLVGKVMLEMARKRIVEDLDSLGLDSEDFSGVDLAMTSVGVAGDYEIGNGTLSMKDVYKLYRFSNTLVVLPMTGRQIRDVMEENASEHLSAHEIGGKAYFYTRGDDFTNIIFGGLNFTYDMSRPEGERVEIEGFANGKPFEEDMTYFVVTTNYLMENAGCGLRGYNAEDAIWMQADDGSGEAMPDLIAEYISEYCEENGTLTPELFDWHWSMEYTPDGEKDQPAEDEIAATYAEDPEDGHTYVLFNEPQRMVLSGDAADGKIGASQAEADGSFLVGTLPEDTIHFTVQKEENGNLLLRDSSGRYLTCRPGGGLVFEKEAAAGGCSEWIVESVSGAKHIINAGVDGQQAIEYSIYSNRFTTYRLSKKGIFNFNFYELPD